MKLRSSSKGKAPKYEESSDEEEIGERSSDYDTCSSTDSDDHLLHNVQKRRKRNSCKSRQDELPQDREREMDENIATGNNNLVGVDPREIGAANHEGKKVRRKRRRPTLTWELLEKVEERWISEKLAKDTEDFDLMNQNHMLAEIIEPSSDLIIPLLRYQKEWLAWALKQEKSVSKGGILADEMGMGKTIQAIALVLLKRMTSQDICGNELPSSSASCLVELQAMRGTLVICPLVALEQWVSEIDRCTAKGSTKVLVYHGANRAKTLHQILGYDFVITTYSVVEAEYRKYAIPLNKKCQKCGKILDNCGCEYRRKENADNLVSEQGEVISKGKPILHSGMWDRIILDEAHYIKNRRTKTSQAVFALQSLYKWALSGTPFQNCVGDLYSLICFLRMFPYSYYFCYSCDCYKLEYSPNCLRCNHQRPHFSWWYKNVTRKIWSFGNSEIGKNAMLLLKHRILEKIVLRRTKKGRVADLALPPRIAVLRRDSLDVVEADYYMALHNMSRAQFNTYVEEGTLLNDSTLILNLLMPLRQAVNHPYLVEYSIAAMKQKGKTVDTRSDKICSLCDHPVEAPMVTSCAHIFCKSCLIEFAADMEQFLCPTCSKPLDVDFITDTNSRRQKSETIKGFSWSSSILERIELDNFQTSTKIDALREEIRFMVERDGSAKGIVFSQFTSFLDIIHYALDKSGIHCVQLDGSKSKEERDEAITRFTEDYNCKIFLLSVKAGGVALNLTMASHVFSMEPCWNPAVEWQAWDRIYRIGQWKPIRIVRFIIENTIEEKILKLQEKKQKAFDGIFGDSLEAMEKLTTDDLRELFFSS